MLTVIMVGSMESRIQAVRVDVLRPKIEIFRISILYYQIEYLIS